MQTKFGFLTCFALIACMLVSCTDQNGGVIDDDSGKITFVSGLSKHVTRTSQDGSQWTAGDSIGIYMVESGQTNILNYSNVPYTAETTAPTTAFKSGEANIYYPANEAPVDFVAYYPYSSAITDRVYPVNLANQSASMVAHDLMYATADNKGNGFTSGTVSFEFTHQLSKLILNFVDEKNNVLTPDGLSIKGMNTTAQFDLKTGTLSEEATVTNITPYKYNNSFEAILLPVIIAAGHEVSIVVNGNAYIWNINGNYPGLEIKTGYSYTFKVTVNTSSSEVEGTLVDFNGNSITPWGEGEGGDAETENPDAEVNYTLLPANDAVDVYKDTYLKLTFTGENPRIGTAGNIKVYRANDSTLVDEINMADVQEQLVKEGSILNTKMDILGIGNDQDRYRVVNYNPVTLEGNTAVIKLHYNRLEYDTKYYVLIDEKVIEHADFSGVKETSGWTFTTKKSPAVPTDAAHTVTVGNDETDADFRSIQAALDFLIANVDKDAQKTVYIHNGIYEELLFLRGVNNITIKGESREGVIIRYDNYDGLNGGVGGSVSFTDPKVEMGTTLTNSGGRCLFLVEAVDKLRFESLTIENIHVKTGDGDQAETVYANNDNKGITFIDCNLLSCQDTLNLKGFCWFYNCLVAGDVDFIWGSPAAALFEKCEIRSVGSGYIVQSRVVENNKGFVFLDCELTATGEADDYKYMYLCRTAGKEANYDNVTFANCKMAGIYGTYGWGLSDGADGTAPNPSIATVDNGYKIYNCTDLDGEEIVIKNSEYAHTLSEEEYTDYFSSREVILSAYADGTDWFSE